MNYVTTNIRILKSDYLRLKAEAAQKRMSLSAVIREKIKADTPKRTPEEVASMLYDLDDLARKNREKLKGIGIVQELRDIRYHGKLPYVKLLHDV